MKSMTGVPQMTKALTLDDAREAQPSIGDPISPYEALIAAILPIIPNRIGAHGQGVNLARRIADLIDAKIAIARQEIAALSDGDRTRADDASVDLRHDELPQRIRVEPDPNGFWSCAYAVSGSPEFIRVDLHEAALRSRDATIGDQARRIGEAGRLVEDARVELQMLLPAGIAGENVARWLDRALVLLALGALRRVPLTPGAGKDET